MNKYEYNVYMISNFKFRKGYDENGYYYYYYGEDVVTGALSYECWDVHTGTHYVYDIVSSEWHVLTLNTREIFWASCYDIPESDWEHDAPNSRPGQYTKCTKTYGADGLTLDEEGKLKACGEVPQEYHGLDRYEARKKIVDMLHSEKSHVEISEIQLS